MKWGNLVGAHGQIAVFLPCNQCYNSLEQSCLVSELIFSRDFNQKLLLNNFLITSTSETSHGPWKIQDIFLMPIVERSLMVSKTVVKVSDWEPEDCNNLTHVIYFLIIFEMVCITWLFFGSYSLGTIFSDLINVHCTICNCVGLGGGGVKDFLSRFFQTNS